MIDQACRTDQPIAHLNRYRELKKKRDELEAAKDRAALKPVLRQIHALKHQLRRATV